MWIIFTIKNLWRNIQEYSEITDLTLSRCVDFRGASFAGYRPGDIRLSDAMFGTNELIYRNLNRVNNTQGGTLFFNSLRTLRNNAVRVDWMEQLVEKIRTYQPLFVAFAATPSLRQSIFNELSQPCYSGSEVLNDFKR
ncbi:hypothetical protein ABK905_21355 [Acerihabitans sp. KWT182]|uniref:Uncharacterized protein n=1 Tax=Acerihabitans sp. KWT182 TaxID=3157919 RepID=A0AAU7Q8L0_9GAMM